MDGKKRVGMKDERDDEDVEKGGKWEAGGGVKTV